MRTWALVAWLVIIGTASAGCTDVPSTSVPARPVVTMGLITPGVWNVNGNTDYIMIWIHHETSGTQDVHWNVTGADGTALPANWTITASRTTATLKANGTKATGSQGEPTYPDWAYALLTLRLPPNTTAGSYALRFDAGPASQKFTAVVAANRTRVSAPGDKVNVHYDGKFNDNQQRFDQGDFPYPVTLGQGATVPGFDNGLIGLGLHEKATLIIPPPFGYGYDNTDAAHARFNGRTLRFDVEITAFQ